MKKIASMFFVVCLALLLAVPAFADGRGPAFSDYTVVCKKPVPYYQENWDKDGVMEKKGTFPAGTEREVEYEYEKDGVLYGWVNLDEYETENWDYGYIRISDVELKDSVYMPENAQKMSKPQTVRVIGKGGVVMYAGPNKKYSAVATIPRGTKLTYSYSNDQSDYYRTWAYVTYLGRNGWIYVYSSDTKNGLAQVPDAADKAEIWVLGDDVRMYDGLSFGNIENEISYDWISPETRKELHEEPDRVVGTLQNGKKYTYRYSHGSDYGTWYYVTAGLRSGWVFQPFEVRKFAVALTEDKKDEFLTYRDLKLKLRESPSQTAKSETVTIPKNTFLSAEYETATEDGYYYYQTINGKSGWYSSEDADSGCAGKLGMYDYESGQSRKNTNSKSTPIYSDIMKRSKTVGTIPPGGFFTTLYYGSYSTQIDEDNYEYTWFYYVRCNDVTGWVDGEELNDLYEEETTEPEEIDLEDLYDEEWEEEDRPYQVKWEDPYTDDEERYDDVDDYTAPSRSLSPMQIVLVSVGGAVVLALTAAVTLLLIRRRQKAKAASAGAQADALPREAEEDPAQEPVEAGQTQDLPEPEDDTDAE